MPFHISGNMELTEIQIFGNLEILKSCMFAGRHVCSQTCMRASPLFLNCVHWQIFSPWLIFLVVVFRGLLYLSLSLYPSWICSQKYAKLNSSLRFVVFGDLLHLSLSLFPSQLCSQTNTLISVDLWGWYVGGLMQSISLVSIWIVFTDRYAHLKWFLRVVIFGGIFSICLLLCLTCAHREICSSQLIFWGGSV